MRKGSKKTTEAGIPIDTGRKLNAHKMFRRRPGHSIYPCVYREYGKLPGAV